MSNTIEQLKKNAKFHEYFWNGLFAALYEPLREKYPVVSLTVPGRGYYIPASETAIKNYLSCKTKMDFDSFLVFCHGLKFDIEKKRFMEVLPYVNRAIAYLGEQEFSGKASGSKTRRQKAFNQADFFMDDNYLWEQQIAQDEREKAEILETFSNLSPEELALLYRAADGYPFTCECDDTFMDCYCRLNEKGKDLFREALEVERKKWNCSFSDDFCVFCQKMSTEDNPVLQNITPTMLCDKLEGAEYNFLPEDAQNLLKYRNAEPRTWQTLEIFHQIIFSYPEGNIDGMSFSETENLLIFLYWLTDIPSLCR